MTVMMDKESKKSKTFFHTFKPGGHQLSAAALFGLDSPLQNSQPRFYSERLKRKTFFFARSSSKSEVSCLFRTFVVIGNICLNGLSVQPTL